MSLIIHSEADFVKMRAAGKLAAEVLDYIIPFVKENVSCEKLNDLCHDYILLNGATPAPLNYNGFPKSICTSINHVVCHGIPDSRRLKNGDILNIDVTVILNGWHGDTSRMFLIGENVSLKAKKIVQISYETMMKGIETIKPGATLGDLGHAMSSHANQHGFSVVKEYGGHGIGEIFHDDPFVPNHGEPGKGLILKEGMFFTVEPMINEGTYKTIVSSIDKWTVTTRDKKLSAQFEHTVGVTKDGYEIFTLSPANAHYPPYG